mmetsp:Transcript_7480/g.18251  ORF Transcript_7480/g.18251 Transcript_7480/m.18251 type:complete len:206 (+) Transcript_7480:150-767(+)
MLKPPHSSLSRLHMAPIISVHTRDGCTDENATKTQTKQHRLGQTASTWAVEVRRLRDPIDAVDALGHIHIHLVAHLIWCGVVVIVAPILALMPPVSVNSPEVHPRVDGGRHKHEGHGGRHLKVVEPVFNRIIAADGVVGEVRHDVQPRLASVHGHDTTQRDRPGGERGRQDGCEALGEVLARGILARPPTGLDVQHFARLTFASV